MLDHILLSGSLATYKAWARSVNNRMFRFYLLFTSPDASVTAAKSGSRRLRVAERGLKQVLELENLENHGDM